MLVHVLTFSFVCGVPILWIYQGQPLKCAYHLSLIMPSFVYLINQVPGSTRHQNHLLLAVLTIGIISVF